MATQYFCTPPNPQLDKYWDTVADRLFKIRNCMNIEGIVRQLALFEPPIDPGLLVRAAAAGVDLGSVIASLNAPPPHYRFRFLLARAVRLAEEIRTFGAMTLQVLERRDAEALAALRASNEVALLNAVRDVRKKQVRQVEEALAELSVQREHIDIQIQHLNAQLQQLMSPQEAEKQKSLSAAQVLSGVQQGIELVSKVMHAIPEFQTGAAGGFSSPFVTLQLGGQMFGDIAEAFASSVQSVMSQNETAADLAEAQAEYQRRKEEWEHELELLKKEKAKVEKKIAETNLKLEIASAELRCHDLDVENSRKVQTFFRDKYTNEQLYGWMLGQLSSVYFQAYKVAFDAAQQAERAFRFERGDSSSSFVEFSYWDSLKKGLLAGERLLLDLRRMESAHVEGDRRSLEVTRHISLREDFPLAWLELVATGRCQIEVTEALLDGDFPGHFFRRIKTASLTVSGVRTPHRNVNCTVTLLENRIRTNANASGAYAQSADGEDSRFSVNPVPIQAIATSKPDADAGVFHLRFDDDRYLPFEGAGAISTWRIELPQADNALALDDVSDVVLSLSYTARTGGGALEAVARADREKGLGRGGIKPEPQHLVSVKRDFPAVWKQLGDAAAGQEVEASLPLPPELFSGRFRGLDLRVERVTMFAYARGELGADALKVRLDPPKGSGTAASGWVPPWPRSRVIRATAEVSGPAGTWKLAVTPTGRKLAELVDDLVLVFDVRARRK
jgi:Tc toxin complex TcA C-terminal TcB-binding domain